jgi:hypothetical protein
LGALSSIISPLFTQLQLYFNMKQESEAPSEDVPTKETWPPEPTPMGKHGLSLYLGIITDVACILAAIPFLVLAGSAARLDARVVSPAEWDIIYAAMNAVD